MSIFLRAKESLPEALEEDHCYALPPSPTTLKARFHEALARVESLEQEKKNAMAREKRARIALQRLLADLREKKLISDEFKERLEYYEDVFTQQMAFGKELMSDTHQNLIQGVVLEPSVTEEKPQDEQLQDLHDVEIIEFTYNSKHATTPRDDFQLPEEQESDPGQDVAQVLSSDTEDSEDYSKDNAEVRPSRENSEWFCRPKEGFSCQACSRTFKHRRVLFRHATVHIRDAEQVCGLCGERFGADGDLKLHLQTHTRKRKKLDPALCGEQLGADGGSKPHRQTHTRKRKMLDPAVCGEQLGADGGSKPHQQTQTRKRKMLDPALCGKQLGADGGSKPHQQTRTRKAKKQGLAKTQSSKKGVPSPSEHNKNKKIEKADDSSKPLVKRPRGRPRKNKQDQDNSGGTTKMKRD